MSNMSKDATRHKAMTLLGKIDKAFDNGDKETVNKASAELYKMIDVLLEKYDNN